MKEQIIESLQQAASGKVAIAVVATTASAPGWIDKVVTDPSFGSTLIILGAFVSVSILAVNGQAFIQRLSVNKLTRRQERIRLLLLESQAKEKNLSVD